MKYLLTLAIIIGLVNSYCIHKLSQPNFGGVRGGARTGFHLMAGESIGIGTSTPEKELHTYKTGTSTIFMDGTVAGSVIMRDTDTSGCSEIFTLNGTVSGIATTCPIN